MVLGANKKRFIFIVALLVALATVFGLRFNSDVYNIDAAESPTRNITITKRWLNDAPVDRPHTITAYIKKTSTTLIDGPTLNTTMKTLAGTTASTTSSNSNITAFRKANESQYEAVKSTLASANEIQASGEKTYMWFSGGVIYYYTEADNIYLPSDSSQIFRKLSNLTDISGAADFITSYATTFEQMFQDDYNLPNSQLAHLANWDVGNVTTMRFMFGGNSSGSTCNNNLKLTDLSSLGSWNTQSLQNTDQMFKCNKSLINLSPIGDWNMLNLQDMRNMFNLTGVTDMTPILDWDVVRVTNFTGVFSNTPISTYDEFAKRPGSWDTSGWTYTPNNTTPASGTAPVVTKVKSPDQDSCTNWDKTNDASGVWTCTISVSNDGSVYSTAWEDPILSYNASADSANPTSVVNDTVTLNNTFSTINDSFITLEKYLSGNAVNMSDTFSFEVKLYDENGVEDSNYTNTYQLGHGGSSVVLVVPENYSYSISEGASNYSASYTITKTSDGTEVKAGTVGTNTGMITPLENQTVTFTNTKTKSATKQITITKQWVGDTSAIRPANITAYINKTTSTLMTGENFRSKLTALAGQLSNIRSIVYATDAQYQAKKSSLTTSTNGVSVSGDYPTYAWYDNGTIYIYSEADNIYMNANAFKMFQGYSNLVDISALSKFNTTYTTNMGLMFQDSRNIDDLTPLKDWDVGNVTSMRYMLGSTTSTPMSYTSVAPLASWNPQKVTDMNGMFRTSGYVTDLSPLANWMVENVADVHQMFNRTGLNAATFPNTTGLENWRLVRVGGSYINVNNGSTATGTFNMMFANLHNMSSNYTNLPVFNGRSGTWNSSGNYSTSISPLSGSATTVTKTPTADTQTCTGTGTGNGQWNKSRDNDGIWTCTLTVSNDDSIYTAWEDAVPLYTGSAYSDSRVNIIGDTATITNTMESYKITLEKSISGNLADLEDIFTFPITVYDASGAEVPNYTASQNLKNGETKSFIIPQGYKYKIDESNLDYKKYTRDINYTRYVKVVESAAGGATILSQTEAASTGIITPSSDHTVTFTNVKEEAPITGVFHDKTPFAIMIAITVGITTGFAGLYWTRKVKPRARDG